MEKRESFQGFVGREILRSNLRQMRDFLYPLWSAMPEEPYSEEEQAFASYLCNIDSDIDLALSLLGSDNVNEDFI